MLSTIELRKLRNYFSTQPVEKAYLFGSYARNEECPESDIDILIDFEKNAIVGLIKFYSMEIDLENLFSRKVDLLETEGISKFIAPTIEKEKKLIYEKGAR